MSLSHLDLSHNEISSFESGSSDLAQAGDDLRTLDLSHNAIEILGDHALDGLGSLLELDLSSNQVGKSENIKVQLIQKVVDNANANRDHNSHNC